MISITICLCNTNHKNVPLNLDTTVTVRTIGQQCFRFVIMVIVSICARLVWCQIPEPIWCCLRLLILTHWGRVTHICVGKLTNIDSANGLSPQRRQAIIWTNVGTLLTGPLGTNFREFLIGIHTFSFKKMHLKMSANWRPCCLRLNVLNGYINSYIIICPCHGSCHKAWDLFPRRCIGLPYVMILNMIDLSRDYINKVVQQTVNVTLPCWMLMTLQMTSNSSALAMELPQSCAEASLIMIFLDQNGPLFFCIIASNVNFRIWISLSIKPQCASSSMLV